MKTRVRRGETTPFLMSFLTKGRFRSYEGKRGSVPGCAVSAEVPNLQAALSLFLTMRAENRTSAAEDEALQGVAACGAGLSALAVNAQIGGIAVVSALA